MTKINLNRIHGTGIAHYVNNKDIILLLNYSTVHRDISEMNILLSEYAILNPLT